MHATGVDAALRGVAGQVAGAVSVAVAMTGEGPYPTTASSFAVASLDPPLATLSLGRTSRLASILERGDPLTISVLASGAHDLAVRFSRSHRRPGWDVFSGVDLQRRGDRPPVLVRAAAWIDADVVESIGMGDHVCVVLRIVEAGRDLAAEPLIYHRGRFHGLGRLVAPDRWSPRDVEELAVVW
jgi:3-hydroxy-9,10-secoandrosta-1,3,5(10)-triene-9,17-dione monooxygenase reductase component